LLKFQSEVRSAEAEANAGQSGSDVASVLLDGDDDLWKRPEATQLRDLLEKAYPDIDQAEHLAKTAAVNLGRWDKKGGIEPAWNRLLETAASQGKLRQLIERALDDEKIQGFHDKIRNCLQNGAEPVASMKADGASAQARGSISRVTRGILVLFAVAPLFGIFAKACSRHVAAMLGFPHEVRVATVGGTIKMSTDEAEWGCHTLRPEIVAYRADLSRARELRAVQDAAKGYSFSVPYGTYLLSLRCIGGNKSSSEYAGEVVVNGAEGTFALKRTPAP
jgi:hypothetical protein